ncbi:MAG TPA: peptidoglycan-associated lipoprotein Pal [Thermoanaerobaculia bacterium]|jgi:peptidoglycan-associated lipoprotein
MKRNRAVTTALALTLGSFGLSACRKNPPTTAASARPPVQVAGPAETAVAPPTASASHDLNADVLSQDLASLNRKGYLTDAFFDLDSADLREEARSTLARDAEWLKKFSSVQILLEGHCDDRGTEAYNLALGQRRANAAREYLQSLGVSESRIRTVSYGKERPFCEADTGSCWQENRRDHVLVTAK